MHHLRHIHCFMVDLTYYLQFVRLFWFACFCLLVLFACFCSTASFSSLSLTLHSPVCLCFCHCSLAFIRLFYSYCFQITRSSTPHNPAVPSLLQPHTSSNDAQIEYPFESRPYDSPTRSHVFRLQTSSRFLLPFLFVF